MTQGKKGSRPAGRKGAVLNIIYFVDAAKTRSFSLPVGVFHTLLLGVVGMMIWSVASFFVLYELYESRMDVRARFATALSSLLDYQIRFDGVFEAAYPIRNSKLTEDPNETAPEIVANAQPSPSSIVATTSSQVTEPTIAEEPAPENTVATTQTTPSNTPKPSAPESVHTNKELPTTSEQSPPMMPVALKNHLISLTSKGTFNVKFEIHNEAKGQRADGLVWGIATFVDQNGNEFPIPAPKRVGLNKASGKVNYPKRAERFSIQRFRAIDLTFQNPDPAHYTLKDIMISISDPKDPANETQRIPFDQSLVAKYAAEPTSPNHEDQP